MKRIIILPMLFGCLILYGQRTKDIKVRVGDQFILSSIHLKASPKSINLSKDYHWYFEQRIHHNTGGYHGYLLHGRYKRFDAENRMLESGAFRRGKKVGRWILWDANGRKLASGKWKNGLKKGMHTKWYSEREAEYSFYRRGEMKMKNEKGFLKFLVPNCMLKNGL